MNHEIRWNQEWRTYYADEARARKIADSMAKRHGWKVKQMIREW